MYHTDSQIQPSPYHAVAGNGQVRAELLRSAPVRRARPRAGDPASAPPLVSLVGGALWALVRAAAALPLLLLWLLLLPAAWLLHRARCLCHALRPGGGAAGGPARAAQPQLAVLVFERQLDVSRLRNLVAARVLPACPRLRRLPVSTPGVPSPRWTPDRAFSIERHVFAAPPLASEQQLQEYVSELLQAPLPPDQPPWELRVLAAGGDTAAVLRAHPGLADGASLVRLLCCALADRRARTHPGPTCCASAAGAKNGSTPGRGRWLASRALQLARACVLCPLSLPAWLLLTPRASDLLAGHGDRDAWTVHWSAAIALPHVVRIKQVTRTSVNGVLLAAVAGALRRALQAAGVRQPPDLSALVAAAAPGLEGAVPRLWATRAALRSVHRRALLLRVATAALLALAPGGYLLSRLLRALACRSSLQFASLSGPAVPLQVGGRSLKAVFPLLAPLPPLGLAVTALTYGDRVLVCVAADTALAPAATLLLAQVRAQVETTWRHLLLRRVPGEARPLTICSPVRELRLRLSCVQEEIRRLSCSDGTQRLQQHQQQQQQQQFLLPRASCTSSASPQPTPRVRSLCAEFSDLLAELRRRRSLALGERIPLCSAPRRRAASASSVRRSFTLGETNFGFGVSPHGTDMEMAHLSAFSCIHSGEESKHCACKRTAANTHSAEFVLHEDLAERELLLQESVPQSFPRVNAIDSSHNCVLLESPSASGERRCFAQDPCRNCDIARTACSCYGYSKAVVCPHCRNLNTGTRTCACPTCDIYSDGNSASDDYRMVAVGDQVYAADICCGCSAISARDVSITVEGNPHVMKFLAAAAATSQSAPPTPQPTNRGRTTSY
ncbi:uncharacterized protein LOC126282424 [Schistocerca gregaria]|uniref:uncharacterized protein LOC126282424 n=1 Tax=Schistocerca gregaria TaxID=7010 RepID=UPI00211F319D|nr:uncharacterized protein LOC126282424 [Schistocerca gregaria]